MPAVTSPQEEEALLVLKQKAAELQVRAPIRTPHCTVLQIRACIRTPHHHPSQERERACEGGR